MFARGVLSLHTAPLSVPKTPTSKSRVSITSKLIETKRLQVLHSGHLRKTGGRGSYQFCQQAFGSPSFPRSFPPISTVASLFFNHLHTLSFSVSHLYPIPPAPSALFSKKRGVYPSGHTNAPDDPRLPLRNLFSALRLSELCVSAVSPSSLSSLVRRSFSEGGPLHPSAHQSLPWTHKRHRRRCPQRTPPIFQFARRSGEDCGEQLLCLIEGEREAEEVGAADVGVFFVARGFARGEGCEDIPGRVFGEKFLLRGVVTGNFHHGALSSTADFEEDGGGFFRLERARRIVVGEGNQEARNLLPIRRQRVPPIAVAVVDKPCRRGRSAERGRRLFPPRLRPCPRVRRVGKFV